MLQTVCKLPLLSFSIFFVLFFAATVPASLRTQSGYGAQLSGVISDSSGGAYPTLKSRSSMKTRELRARTTATSTCSPSLESNARIVVPVSRKCSLRSLPFLGKILTDRRPGQRGSPRFRIAGF
jgi:hypothetical protein